MLGNSSTGLFDAFGDILLNADVFEEVLLHGLSQRGQAGHGRIEEFEEWFRA